MRVKTRAQDERVERTGESTYTVWTTEAPERGKANSAVIRLLADYFNVAQSFVELRAGATSRSKIFNIQVD